ncbi:hypothetical protein A3F28_01845 [Candidatus Uhrbacteria bacterium RIFCSPHIGHO2_12_FULL_57_11]|uniref:Cell division protein FtsL n=2 Tax=Candidatus Uhriibacteriota TaxID=1752732 RepID=A0A1F7UM84_9BACT|nr:MAG: hypothetical protein A3D72_02810 [Candidatus Uhrbacteria bacterium RIFCSPHIGHO2_02_FULL_57_19]OGL79390.1 MAG: hypothetical protein A3F28_01845 [Candidatus Uhrbacteria bacterium RIFCSPHIGHO2_12_FULL_57_11]
MTNKYFQNQGRTRSKTRSFVLPPLPIIQSVLIALLAILGIAYLIELNLISQRGFEARRLEKRLGYLHETNTKLQLKLAELESINGIQERIAELGMVPVGPVEYVSAGATVVARR